MSLSIEAAKAELRRQMTARLRALSAEARAAASARLCERLCARPEWQRADTILFFASQEPEPDIWPLLKAAHAAGKRVALPRYRPEADVYTAALVRDLERELARGRFGILEPVATCDGIALAELDLVLVPGVAFDLRGYRLGRGKGYYDRLLVEVRGIKCGVAFDEQIVEAVPAGELDIRLDFVLTPTRWVKAGA
jgi:5-formyltetrahydrofolate cyclo-ligase